MSEEQNAPVEQAVDIQKMQGELEAMRRKNAELLKEYKDFKESAQKQAPAGMDGLMSKNCLSPNAGQSKQSLNHRGNTLKLDRLWSSSSVRRRRKRTSALPS